MLPELADDLSAIGVTEAPVAAAASNWRLWLRTVGYLKPYWRLGVVVALAITLDMAFNAVVPLSVKFLIDDVLVTRDQRLLVEILGGLAVLFVIQSVAGTVRDRVLSTIQARLLNDLRFALLARLQRLSIDFFQRHQVGDLLSYFTNDLASLDEATGGALPSFLRNAMDTLVNVAILICLDWRLAGATLLVMPLATLGPRLLGGPAIEASLARKQKEAALSGTAGENLSGQPLIRAFGLQSFILSRFRLQSADVQAITARSKFMAALVGRSSYIAVTFGELTMIGLGSVLVFRGQMQLGSLVAFIGVLVNVGGGISGLSSAIPSWLGATGAMKRLDHVLNEPVDVSDGTGTITLPRLSSGITFEDVDFGYEPGQLTIKNVSFDIPAGQFVAFVGRSGSGKSTILSLLMRFYQPTSGAIRFDGCDLREITEASLRSNMSVVFQESFLFNTTVRENIRLGRLHATDQEVERAATAAQLDLALLSEGYDTIVGERGGRLSGGQRQRVALARAILEDPAILLLDEATSALDPATETAFNATLAQYARNRTVISVTHRLTGIRHADQIYVVDGGRIVEHGSHDELMAHGGLYRSIVDKQSGFTLGADSSAEMTAERLAAIPLFEGIKPAALAPLANLFFSEHYEAGDEIYAVSHPGDRFYVIVRGTVVLSRSGDDGSPAALGTLQDGDFFGAFELLAGGPRQSSAVARTPCVLLVLARDHFLRLVEAVPVLRTVFEHVAEVTSQQEQMRAAAALGISGWSDSA